MCPRQAHVVALSDHIPAHALHHHATLPLCQKMWVKLGVPSGSFSFYILWFYNRAKYLLNKQFERASLRGDVHFQKHVSFKTQMEYYLLCPLGARHSIASVRWSSPSVSASALITHGHHHQPVLLTYLVADSSRSRLLDARTCSCHFVNW